jgi:hypothetical protein
LLTRDITHPQFGCILEMVVPEWWCLGAGSGSMRMPAQCSCFGVSAAGAVRKQQSGRMGADHAGTTAEINSSKTIVMEQSRRIAT